MRITSLVEFAARIIPALAALGLPKEIALDYLERFRGAMLTGRVDDAVPGPLPVVQEVQLARGALADQSLRQARIRERFGVTVVALTRRGGVVFNPAPETILRAGDIVRVFGLQSQISAFTALANPTVPT